jgi:hypothetical protein
MMDDLSEACAADVAKNVTQQIFTNLEILITVQLVYQWSVVSNNRSPIMHPNNGLEKSGGIE